MRGRTNVPVRPNAIINGSLKTYTVADGQNIEKGDFVRVYTEPISYEIYPSLPSTSCPKITSYGEYIIFRTRLYDSFVSTVIVFDSKLNQLYSTTQLNGNDIMDVYVLNDVLYILTVHYVSSPERYYIVNKCSLNSDYSFNVVSSYSFNPSSSSHIIGGLCALDNNIFIYLVGKSTKSTSKWVMYAAILLSDGTFSVVEQSNYSYGISTISTSIASLSFVAMERISGDKFVVTYPNKYAWVYTLSLSDMTPETSSLKSAYVNSSDNVLVCALNNVAYTYNISDSVELTSSLGTLKNWFCMLNSTHILDASIPASSTDAYTIRHLYYEDGKWNDEVLCTVSSSIGTTSYFSPNGNVAIVNDLYYFLVQGGIIIKVKLQNELAIVQGGVEFVKKTNTGEFINGFTNESGKGGDEIQVYIPK